MNDVTIASSQDDARAAEAVEQHHAQMAGTLALQVESLSAAARARRHTDADEVRLALVAWCRTDLVPHAQAEEGTLYRAAATRSEARLLVEAMLAEHRVILGLVDDLALADDAVSAAETARALRVLFETHLAKENEQLLPLLVADPDTSVAELLGGMHELLGDGAAHHHEAVPAGQQATSHACTCGETAGETLPELDARVIPHSIRHATIFGALDAVSPGHGLVLVAPHDPQPLLAQIEQRAPGAFVIDYLERGPEAWRLSLVRVGA